MEKKTKEFWSRIIKAVGVIISTVAFLLSWVSIFVEIPQIKDWRMGIVVSLIFLMGFFLWHFIDLQNVINEQKGNITSSSQIIVIPMTNFEHGRFGMLSIKNQLSTDVKDCFVDIEEAYWIAYNPDGTKSKGVYKNLTGRLGWFEGELQSKDCKRDIERNNHGTLIKICHFEKNNIVIPLCDKNLIFDSKGNGELNLLLRIGGTVNGWSIDPIFIRSSIDILTFMKGFHVFGGPSMDRLKDRGSFDEWINRLDSNEERRWTPETKESKKTAKIKEKSKSSRGKTS